MGALAALAAALEDHRGQHETLTASDMRRIIQDAMITLSCGLEEWDNRQPVTIGSATVPAAGAHSPTDSVDSPQPK